MINELAIKRVLSDDTHKKVISVANGREEVALHVTRNREVIITDAADFTKIYAVISLDLYQAMNGGKDLWE